MTMKLNRANEFVRAYNDIVNYPTVADVADDLDLSVSRVKSWASEIRKRNAAAECGLEIIASRSSVAKDNNEKALLSPGQKLDGLGRPSPLSEDERKFREDWTAQDCVQHLLAIAKAMPGEDGTVTTVQGKQIHITRMYFRNNSNISDSTWNRYFGTFGEFRRQSGLELSRHAHSIERAIAKHSSTDLMDDLTKMKRGYAGRYERPFNAKERWRTILVGTDFHGMKCDPFVRRMFIEANRRIQPDVINMNGDFFDLAEFSKYTSDPRDFDVMGEIRYNHELFARLREDNPDAQLDFIEGNHEFRLFRHLSEETPALKVLLHDLHGFDIPKLLGLDKYEINFTGRASLKAFTQRDVRKELERNFMVYWDCVLSCHYPERRNLRMPGWGGHHHKHEVWPFFNPQFGPCEFHQMGGGQVRAADFMDGEIWQNGIMIAHVDTIDKQTMFEYIPIGDFCVLGGQYYYRDDE